MRLLLDTATFLWAISSPERISRTAMSALKNDTAMREISAISLSEIAIKQNAGKLSFGKQNVLQGIADLHLRVLAYTAEHALGVFGLPLHHRDPFDRQIIAQAITENISVVTGDRMFRLYKGLAILW